MYIENSILSINTLPTNSPLLGLNVLDAKIIVGLYKLNLVRFTSLPLDISLYAVFNFAYKSAVVQVVFFRKICY